MENTTFKQWLEEAIERENKDPEYHALTAGDVDIYANSRFVRITVDGETVLTFPRDNPGFKEFAKKIYDLS